MRERQQLIELAAADRLVWKFPEPRYHRVRLIASQPTVDPACAPREQRELTKYIRRGDIDASFHSLDYTTDGSAKSAAPSEEITPAGLLKHFHGNMRYTQPSTVSTGE
jgi:hypothetical protein